MALSRSYSGLRQSNGLAYGLLAPSLLVLAPFAIVPFFYAVYLSLYEFAGNSTTYVGPVHYVDALGREDFWDSVRVTIYFAVGTVLPTLVVSVILAMVLSQIERLQSFLRMVYFLPFITSVVAAALIWRAMFDPANGPITQFMVLLGLEPQRWLLEPRGVLHVISGGRTDAMMGPSLALCCVIVFEIWRSVGFMVVILLAALVHRSRGLEEAATLEGASRIQVGWHVILPGIMPTLVFLAIVSTIQSFQAFNGFFALTGDGRGPLDTTQNMTVYIYTQFYEYGHVGYGSANAVLLTIAIMAFTLVQWGVARRGVTES
jgi:ABC-type sugar transport system permease subunit